MLKLTYGTLCLLSVLQFIAVGCGDDDNPSPSDAGRDAGMRDAGGDSGGADGGSLSDSGPSDAGPAVGTSCTLSNGNGGVINSSRTCVPCSGSEAGDLECSTAYGSGYLCLSNAQGNTCTLGDCRAAASCTSGQVCSSNQCTTCAGDADCTNATTGYGPGYLCSAGSCVAGNCKVSSDCGVSAGTATGQVCGSATPNTCGSCTSDSMCGADSVYSAQSKTICHGGFCVANMCTSVAAGTAPTLCPSGGGLNTCCPAGGNPTVGVCIPGTSGTSGTRCCGTGQSNCPVSEQCISNVCTLCPPVPTSGTLANTYFVDPTNGSDSGNGYNNVMCRFKTVSRAFTVMKNQGLSGTVVLLGDTSVARTEQFPLSVPANVTLIGGSVSGEGTSATITNVSRTVSIQNGTSSRLVGFTIAGSNSRIAYLIIDGTGSGSGTRGSTGIVIAGASQTGVTLDHVTVQNTFNEGIVVGGSSGGTLVAGNATMGPGVVVTGSGTTGNRSSGVLLAGSATATVMGGSAEGERTAFTNNTDHGIAVVQSAGITIMGNGNAAGPSVSTNANANEGLAIQQKGANLSANEVTGLVSSGSTLAGGILVDTGSKLKLRNSVVLSNHESGIRVKSVTASHDITQIDLGTDTTSNAGGNTLQCPRDRSDLCPSGQTPNRGVGICLEIRATNLGSQVLAAQGNVFATTANDRALCASAASPVYRLVTSCLPGATSIPVAIGTPTLASSVNAVNVSSCTVVVP